MSNGYQNPFSSSFTALKLRYAEYDKSIDAHQNFISQNDKINVFISLESVLNKLSMITDIEDKLLLERNHKAILESEAINLCAHYKKFFRAYGLPTRVFMYYTDLNSDDFINFKYNDEYRSFYINKFIMNPRYQLLGGSLIGTIVPNLKKIMEFIPDVHFIKARDIEGSLVPFIIANSDKSYKNFLISADIYESQYQLYSDRFCTHIIRNIIGGSGPRTVFDTLQKTLEYLFKDQEKNIENSEILANPIYYSLVMSAAGDKLRSIDPLKGIGYKTFLRYLAVAVANREITDTTKTLESVISSLPIEEPEQTVQNFRCINLEDQLENLTDDNIFAITNQIVDRFDYNSLLQLNATRYKDYPLMLQELTM